MTKGINSSRVISAKRADVEAAVTREWQENNPVKTYLQVQTYCADPLVLRRKVSITISPSAVYLSQRLLEQFEPHCPDRWVECHWDARLRLLILFPTSATNNRYAFRVQRRKGHKGADIGRSKALDKFLIECGIQNGRYMAEIKLVKLADGREAHAVVVRIPEPNKS